jgi:hypothetical protein
MSCVSVRVHTDQATESAPLRVTFHSLMNSDDSVMITVASWKFIARLHSVKSRNSLHSRRCEDALITIRLRFRVSPVCAVSCHTSFSVLIKECTRKIKDSTVQKRQPWNCSWVRRWHVKPSRGHGVGLELCRNGGVPFTPDIMIPWQWLGNQSLVVAKIRCHNLVL